MKPHKHAEVIKALADGQQIQYQIQTGEWRDYDPFWSPSTEWRIKPKEKVVRWLWITLDHDCETWYITDTYWTEDEAKHFCQSARDYRKLEWSREEFDE